MKKKCEKKIIKEEDLAFLSNAEDLVLAGTYNKAKGENLWINKHKLYCYPLSAKEAKIPYDFWKKCTELWLYPDYNGGRNIYDAQFIEIKSRKDLIRDYSNFTDCIYPNKNNTLYAIFKVEMVFGPKMKDSEVIIRVRDFVSPTATVIRTIKEFQDGKNKEKISRFLPKELTNIESSHICFFESSIQLNFFDILDNYEQVETFNHNGQDNKSVRFIDLFAGIGGIRKGFEQACIAKGLTSHCVFTSEIKPHAIKVLKQNHPDDYIHGDITEIEATSIPDFDILLGGFPCQAFSSAGKRHGFEDTRGTLFFDVARILKEKKPFGFVLENVEGLVNHDKRESETPYGNTLKVILETLEELGYMTSWRVLNAKDFGVPQERKRIYIIGTRKKAPSLEQFKPKYSKVGEVLEHGHKCSNSTFVQKLLSHYSVQDLYGKAIKDKRGGKNNIHSWDFELKGEVSLEQKKLLNLMLRERRKRKWAEVYGIDWMDGMPLTLEMIQTFFDVPELESMLEDLVAKKYVVKEHPKRRVKNGRVFERVEDVTLPIGYNIVAGKMSFEVSKILSPEEQAPTLVAMDMQHLYVVDGSGIRNLSLREGLNLFGYPKEFKFEITKDLGYDLLGNTVVVPVITEVAGRMLDIYKQEKEIK